MQRLSGDVARTAGGHEVGYLGDVARMSCSSVVDRADQRGPPLLAEFPPEEVGLDDVAGYDQVGRQRLGAHF